MAWIPGTETPESIIRRLLPAESGLSKDVSYNDGYRPINDVRFARSECCIAALMAPKPPQWTETAKNESAYPWLGTQCGVEAGANQRLCANRGAYIMEEVKYIGAEGNNKLIAADTRSALHWLHLENTPKR